MDYSKTTSSKRPRTRLQYDLFYENFNEEKKKAARSHKNNSGENVATVAGFVGVFDCYSFTPGQWPNETSIVNDGSGEWESSKKKRILDRNGMEVTVENDYGEDDSSGRSSIAKLGKSVTVSGRSTITKLKQKFCRNERGVGNEELSSKGESFGKNNVGQGSCLKGKILPGKLSKKDENMNRIGVFDGGEDCDSSEEDVVILSVNEVGIEDKSSKDESSWKSSNSVKSIKEDIYDPDDLEFRANNSSSWKEITNSLEAGEKDLKSEIKKRKCGNEMERASFIEGGLKRKKVYGLDILIDREKEEAAEHKGPATRLRSCSFSKCREKNLKLGGINRPIVVEEYDELDSSSDSDNNGVRKNNGKQEVKSRESSVEKKAHSENKRSSWDMEDKLLETDVSPQDEPPAEGPQDEPPFEGPQDKPPFEGPQDKPRAEGRHAKPPAKGPQDEPPAKGPQDEPPAEGSQYESPEGSLGEPPAEGTLPYKFRFEDKNESAKLAVKSEWEVEVDALFAEMDMVSTLSAIGSFISYEDDMKGDAYNPKNETDQATLCLQGKHQLFLHEPYGIMCKFCSHIDLEMKHILLPLVMNPFERRDKYYFDKAYSSSFSELQLQDTDFQCPYGSKSNGLNYEKGTVWDLIPGKIPMNPHQHEGFEFIWKNIGGGLHIEKLEKNLTDGGSGCIISHAPGTGKTRLTIVFLMTFMKLYPEARPVIIAPLGVLRTWENELRTWNSEIPFYNLNSSDFSVRINKLKFWQKESSILGISYKLFEHLAGRGGKRKKYKNNPNDEQIRKCLLRRPSLLVLDEGHIPRTKESLIYKTLSKVKTQRRIILSGTPFQNNFEELYNMFCFVNPKFVESISYRDSDNFSKRRGRKISAAKEKWAALTSSIGKNRNSKLRELRAMMNPFVHVHKGSILQEKLPGRRDSLVVLRPATIQKTLLEIIPGLKECSLKVEFLMSLISVHPSLLPEDIAEREEFSALRNVLKSIEKNPYAGVKTKFLIELIRISEQLKEKVLIFSKYIDPLNFIMEMLETHFSWIEGKEILQMDGKIDEKNRHSLITSFNDPNSEAKVLLASIKACNEGINLVGASRVVLLDVNWNPSVEQQAISRAYRLGQKKVVHVYHLVTGKMEGEKYLRQFEKALLSNLVFCCKNGNRYEPEISSTVAEDKILEGMVQHENLKDMFEKVICQPNEL